MVIKSNLQFKGEWNMNYVNRLKHRNLWEILGFTTKNHPKKMISAGIAFVLVLIAISSTPHFIYMYNKNVAKNYIETAQSIVTGIDTKNKEAKDKLTTYQKIYKDYDTYMSVVASESETLSGFVDLLKSYHVRYEKKEIEGILSDFNSKKSKITLIDLAKRNQSEFEKTYADITSVYAINGDLQNQYRTLNAFGDQSKQVFEKVQNQNIEVQRKGKTARVKQKSKNLFEQVKSQKDNFTGSFGSLASYTKNDEGEYDLPGLKQLQSNQSSVISLMNTSKNAASSFDGFWNELHEQYYTFVADDYSTHSTDYVSEPNPLYKEWTEQEKYQDTETKYKSESYTERVYKGSRINGDKKEDIYETVTKTRQVPYQVQVTKTRNVTKNNSQPRMVPIPYDVYKFYYKVEKHTSSGMTSSDEYVGKKHAKYDYSIRTWDYSDNEEEGYVVWKQLWNDSEGIVKGQNLHPTLEQ